MLHVRRSRQIAERRGATAKNCCWLLLTAADCCWLLLTAADCCWLLQSRAQCVGAIAAVSSSQQQSAAVSSSQQQSAAVSSSLQQSAAVSLHLAPPVASAILTQYLCVKLITEGGRGVKKFVICERPARDHLLVETKRLTVFRKQWYLVPCSAMRFT